MYKRSPRRSPRKRSSRKRSPRKRSPRKRSPRKRSPRKSICWKGYHRVRGTSPYSKGSCAKN